jgi:L-lactate dehydrogenase complex protein LldG
MQSRAKNHNAGNNSAREAIFESIRANLAASKTLDARELTLHHAVESGPVSLLPDSDSSSLVDRFKESLEAVEGHCVVVQSESELVLALTDIITKLQSTHLRARSIAISDSPEIERLVNLIDAEVEALSITPSSSDIFSFDVGISRVQAGIAETGTLVLDSSRERHRWVSLVPPVHIAILDASQIVRTLGEALSLMQKDDQMSPIVTLVTGPSRTADIELTLAIGVHGPQEVYVMVRDYKE